MPVEPAATPEETPKALDECPEPPRSRWSDQRVSRVDGYATFGGVRNWLFVRVETDGGFHGWGEASTEQWDDSVLAAVSAMGERLRGQDPMATEKNWQQLSRHGFWRGGIILQSALSALDQAMWDIRGKILDVPVYRLLSGPTRDWVKTYRHVGIYRPELVVEEALTYVATGVRTLKTGAWAADSALAETERRHRFVGRFAELREAVGDDVELMIDNHGRSRPDEAIRLIRDVAPYRPAWIEEPIAPEAPELIRPVAEEARRHGISIALGERLLSRWETRHVFEQQLVDVIQPDLCHAGGITEVLKIASMADVYRCAVAPHNPAGPVSTAAAAHVAMAISNFSVLEYCPDEKRRSEVQIDPWVHEGDRLFVPPTPGLGVELDIDAIRDIPARATSVPVSAFAEDGSVADI